MILCRKISSILVFSDHFLFRLNSDFLCCFHPGIAAVISGKTPPKDMEWSWAPPHLLVRKMLCDFSLMRTSLIPECLFRRWFHLNPHQVVEATAVPENAWLTEIILGCRKVHPLSMISWDSCDSGDYFAEVHFYISNKNDWRPLNLQPSTLSISIFLFQKKLSQLHANSRRKGGRPKPFCQADRINSFFYNFPEYSDRI